MDGFLAVVRIEAEPITNTCEISALAENATRSCFGELGRRVVFANANLVFVCSLSAYASDSAVQVYPALPLTYVNGRVECPSTKAIPTLASSVGESDGVDQRLTAIWSALDRSDGENTRLRSFSGSFHAFCHDPIRERTLLLSDRFASRPIFLCRTRDFLYVSSDIRCLLSLPVVDRALDLAGLTQLVRFQSILEDRTLYDAIKMLPAASIITVGHATRSLIRTQYWALNRLSPFATQEDAIESTATVFQAATRRVMTGSHKAGILLSGGMDSRMLVVCLDENERSRVTAHTFGPGSNPETKIAQRVASALGIEWAQVMQTSEHYWRALPDILATSNGLHSFQHAHTHRAASELAKDGYDTLLNGWGLDLLFSGSYMPKGQFRFLRNNLYSFRLEKLGDSLAVASYLYRSLDKQHGVFENSLLDESVRSAWEVFPLEAINRLVDQAVQTGGTPYDWIDHALFSSGIAKFRSYPMLTGIRAHLRERNPLFESDVIEVYQRTPYAWRFLGPLFRRAILRINPTVARIINNNVGMDPTAPASMQALSLDANILWRAGDLRMRTILRRVGLTSARPQLAGNYPEPADFTRLLGDTKTEATEAYRVLLSGPLAQSGMVNPNAIQQAITNCRHGNSESAETLLTLISIAKWLDMYPARLAG